MGRGYKTAGSRKSRFTPTKRRGGGASLSHAGGEGTCSFSNADGNGCKNIPSCKEGEECKMF